MESGTTVKNYTASVTINQPSPTVNLTADTTRVGVGMPVNLNWTTTNAERAYFAHNSNTDVSLNGSVNFYPTADITYTLYAIGYEGFENAHQSVSIDVIDNAVINTFTASPSKITVGEQSTFTWNVTDAESLNLNPYGAIQNGTNNVSITFDEIGAFPYELEATSLNGTKIKSPVRTIEVFGEPIISSLTINGLSGTIYASPNDSLNFEWTTENSETLTLNGNSISGNSTTLSANNTTGTTNYTLSARNGANKATTRTIAVNTISDASIDTFTVPSTVFANSPFTLSWTGSGSTYKLESSSSGSGITAAHESLGSSLNTNVTPTSTGTMEYTLIAKNLADKETTESKSVIVEANPTLTTLLVNGSSSITVSPNDDLSFTSTGLSTGASLQSVQSNDTENSFLTKAPVTAGTYTYYAVAKKTLNGITRKSAKRSVDVTVVNAPTVDMTAPSIVFNNSTFNLNWTAGNQNTIEIYSNNEDSGVSTTPVVVTGNSQAVQPLVSGTYQYTIRNTNAAGISVTDVVSVVVENNPTFTGFTVNGQASVNVAPSTSLTYAISGQSSGATLVGRNAANNANATNPTNAPSTPGSYTYYAAVTKTINSVTRYSNVRSVAVNVIDAPAITTITAPSNVFANAAYSMSWAASNAVSFAIRSDNANSGVSTSNVDMGSTSTIAITPNAAGTYTYTITATNSAGVSTTSTKTVIVEANPTYTNLYVNGVASVTVYPSTSLSFTIAGQSSGATVIGRDSGNTTNNALPSTANSSVGSTTYYASVQKTLNSVTRYSAVRSVSVNVVSAATVNSVTAPTNVFANAPFTISWSGTNVTNYKIKSDNANSGVSTSDIDVATATSRSVTPTAAGTYIYTVTGTNSAGIPHTESVTVIVEANPTISNARINGTATFVNVTNGAALTPTATLSSGATLVENVPNNASSAPGETTYTFSATKTLNGVTRNSSSTTVVVGAGSRFTMVVGRYLEGGGAYQGYGYVNTTATGWGTYTTGGFNPTKIAGYVTYGIYTTNDTTAGLSRININYDVSTPDNIILNKSLWIDGLVCSQTARSFNIWVDNYQYAGCSVNWHNKIGQTLTIYLQN